MQIKTALQHIKNGKLVAINDANSDVGDWFVVTSNGNVTLNSLEAVQNWLTTNTHDVIEVYGYAVVTYSGYGTSFVLDGDTAEQE